MALCTICDVFELRGAGVEDAETISETVQLGFASFRARAGPAAGEPAGHVALTQARERAEPRPDIPGLVHLWMLFVRPAWWGAGSRAA